MSAFSPRWWNLAVLTVVAACGGTPEGGDGEPTSEPQVGQTAQALGNWTELYPGTPYGLVGHVGPLYTFFVDNREGELHECVPYIVRTGTGEVLDVPPLAPCDSIIAVTGDDRSLFVITEYGANDRVFSLVGSKAYAWREVARTDTYEPRMLTSTTHVYWERDGDIHSVSRSGGTVTTVARDRTLVAIDGDKLYVNQRADDQAGGYHLNRMSLTGAGETRLRSNGYFMGGRTTFDSTHFYTVWNNGFPRQLLRIKKDGTSPTVLRESSDVSYSGAFSTGTMLYWMESGSNIRTLRRHNLTNGNQITELVPLNIVYGSLVSTSTKLGPPGIYLAGPSPDTGQEVLLRGDL